MNICFQDATNEDQDENMPSEEDSEHERSEYDRK